MRRNPLLLAVLALLLLVLPSPAAAQGLDDLDDLDRPSERTTKGRTDRKDAPSEEPGMRLGIGAGWFQAGENETIIDGSWTIVPRVGYAFNHTVWLEADVGYSQGVTRSVDRLYHVVTPRLNLLLHLPKAGPLTFFVAAGPGIYWKKVERSPDDEIGTGDKAPSELSGWGQYKNPDTDFLLNAGPGLKIALGKSPVALRTDFRFMYSMGDTPADKDGNPATFEPDRYSNWEWTGALAFSLGPRVRDTDGDGYMDDVDDCIDDPEDFDDYKDEDGCPDRDNDRDGLADTVDRCPDEAEDFDSWQDEDGCPDPDNDSDGVSDRYDDCPLVYGSAKTAGCPDRDADGVVDSADLCPDEAGPASNNGCPARIADRDNDGVPDDRDRCPDEPADPRVDPSRSDGCPARVVVTREQVVILDKVYFDTGRASIKRISHAILNEVAGVLNTYPDIARVEVQGHTDSDGSDAANLDLSQRRAEAVVAYLIQQGVDPSRLSARGYGESVPIADNYTPDGKAQNRRVEFQIVE
ncbi:MAG: OmpA family protein [Alphaproteobacteria bacterium]|nr:OmpA family protein [Alphaproteobacteria bacterium]